MNLSQPFAKAKRYSESHARSNPWRRQLPSPLAMEEVRGGYGIQIAGIGVACAGHVDNTIASRRSFVEK